MDFTGNEFLAISVMIAGTITVVLPSILNCAKRQEAKNGKVLKEQWILNDSKYRRLPSSDVTETLQTPKRHKRLNLRWNNFCLDDKSSPTEITDMPTYKWEMNEFKTEDSPKLTEQVPVFTNFTTDVNANNDSSEEQTAIAEIGTTSTQMTSTVSSIKSQGQLNSSIKLNRTAFKSNSIIEMTDDYDELPNRSNFGDKSVVGPEKNWNKERCCPHCHGAPCGTTRILAKTKPFLLKRMPKKEMVDEYKLSEPVTVMVQKYEEKSRLESEQDDCRF